MGFIYHMVVDGDYSEPTTNIPTEDVVAVTKTEEEAKERIDGRKNHKILEVEGNK